MAVDFEAAWTELQEFVASKSQHGREPTLIKMSELVARHRYPGGELSHLLRQYGVEVAKTKARQSVAPGDFDGGDVSPSDAAGATQHDRGDHDGSHHQHPADP